MSSPMSIINEQGFPLENLGLGQSPVNEQELKGNTEDKEKKEDE